MVMDRRRISSWGLLIVGVLAGVAAMAGMLWAVRNVGAAPGSARLAQGGAPLLLTYQGRLADPATGLPKPDGTYEVVFSLYTDPEAVIRPVWSETQEVVVSRGLFNVLLGSVNPLSPSVFDGTERWLELEVDGETLGPRVRIASVPYAIQARDADTVDGLHASELADRGNVVVVAKSGGDYVSIQTALNHIVDASASNRYLVWVAPGTYTERVEMKSYVDIEGAGQLTTKVACAGSTSEYTGTVIGADNAELRFLTVENTGGSTYSVAVYNESASPRLTHVTALASGSEYNIGLYAVESSSRIQDSVIRASGGSYSYGILEGGWAPSLTVDNSRVSGDTGSIEGSLMSTSYVAGSMLGGGPATGILRCAGVYDEDFKFYPDTCP